MNTNFVHLHVHTAYSLLDGAARIDALIDRAKSFGMDAVAMTDHGVMYGTIEFYKNAVKRGIKPIIGCEVYVAPKSLADKNLADGKPFHLVLLAENNTGYENLIQLASIASLEGFYYKPRVDKNVLREYHEGLIALSACTAGEIPHAILHNKFSRAVELTKEYVEIFGRGNFFLEVQNHVGARDRLFEDEKIVREALREISRELDIGLVATNDVHYVNQSDSEAHDVLLCLQTNKTVADGRRWKFSSDDYYLKSSDEMYALFADFPDACENTVRIAERCNVTLNFDEIHLPEFKIPAGSNASDYLRELCNRKIVERYNLPDEKIYARMNQELDTIAQMGFASYFLIVYDFIDYAKKNGIPVGPGRGSAAGSVVAYLLGITEIDPLKYNLLFERFLNPERVTMPDIDIDFCYRRREEVIDYVKAKYGKDNVSQIVTFGTMAAKAAVRDVARVLNVDYTNSSEIVDKIPNELKITLDRALEISPSLKDAYDSDEKTRKVIDLARKLEGLPRHASVHAAGIVISKLKLTNYLPLQDLKGTVVTQFDKDGIEALGLLKMDFLGLRTLTIIDDALKNIQKNFGRKIDIATIPLNDKETATMLSRGDTGAVFQMESAGMTRLVSELKPTCYEDLIPTIALFRPGPLGSGMVEDFVAGKRGTRKPTYLHPKLEPILRETFGVILYQEQVMQIVQALAGFSLGQADLLRRAMSKKNASILAAQKENFLKGCASNGIETALADKIFGLLEHFADYGFNKSHSAAYALLAWQTAYLKAHYPTEFMAATLSSVMDSDRISVYIELAKRMGIKILPPDINSSGVYFSPTANSVIHFALSAIKNLGEPAIESVVKIRDSGGKFESLKDFCKRMDVKKFNRGALENLIKCGAFDDIDRNRNALLKTLKKILEFRPTQQQSFSFDVEADGTKSVESDRNETPVSKYLEWEKDILGYHVSGHLLDPYKEAFKYFYDIGELKRSDSNSKNTVRVGGLLTNFRNRRTKNNDPMAFATIEDYGGSVTVVIFPSVFKKCAGFLDNGKILVVDGVTDFSKGELEILANDITPIETYTENVYLTLDDSTNNTDTIQRLKKIFANNIGSSKVYLRYDEGGSWRLINKKISASKKVLADLKNLLGDKNVKTYKEQDSEKSNSR